MIKILFAGDVCMAGGIENIILHGDRNRIDDIFKDILPVVNRSDYFVVNLECPLTYSTTLIEKIGPNLKADPKTILLLKNLGVDLVCLANNHIYDYGQTGLRETLQVCTDAGIATVGAGETLSIAQQPTYATIQGIKVAFVNFAEHEFCNADSSQGGANSLDVIENTRQIRNARNQADAVIVIIHGGHEHFHYPSLRMVKQYHFFAEQGATAIIGHHTHCISGYETYQGVPIFYSLGNFLFDSNTNFSGWYEGYMVELEITNTKCKFSIIPYRQCINGQSIERLYESEVLQFKDKLDQLSEPLADAKRLEVIWEEFASQRFHSYLYSISPITKRIKQILWKLKVIQYLYPRRYVLRLLNHVRCESHRNLILYALKKWLNI